MDAPLSLSLACPERPLHGRADLHVHSLHRDGGQAPEAMVRAASGRLDVVAITDEVSGASARGPSRIRIRIRIRSCQSRSLPWPAPVVSLRQGGHRGHS